MSVNRAACPLANSSKKDVFSNRAPAIPLDVRTAESRSADLAIVKLLFYTVLDRLALSLLMELGDAQRESRFLHRKPLPLVFGLCNRTEAESPYPPECSTGRHRPGRSEKLQPTWVE
jgi:hypothetical protein